MRFIHTADWHIGAGRSYIPGSLERTMGVIDDIYALAIRDGISVVVVAGDIFDSPNLLAEEKRALARKILAYDAAGISTLMIPGNHDAETATTSTLDYLETLTQSRRLKHSVVTQSTRLVIRDGFGFLLFVNEPWARLSRHVHDILHGSLKQDLKGLIVVAHQTIKGSTTATGMQMPSGITFAPDKDVDYFAFGDIHTCFPPEVQVMVDYDTCVSMSEAVNSPAITHVLSYNLETKRIEPKRILNKRESDFKGKYVRVTIDDGSTIKSTQDHKYVVVGRGEVEAKDIKAGDQLIKYDGSFTRIYACHFCSATFSTGREKSAHSKTHDSERGGYTCATCDKHFSTRSTYGAHFHKDHPEKIAKQNLVKCSACGLMFKEKNMGSHMFFHDIGRVAARSRKTSDKLTAFYATPEGAANKRAKTFFLDKLRTSKRTRCEATVDAFVVDGLAYTGNGAFWVTLTLPDGSEWRKNPDFVVGDPTRPETIKKVVEVFGGVDWIHTEVEASLLKAAYKEAGYDAVIIFDSQLKNIPCQLEVKAELEAFCNNHYVTVQDVHLSFRKTKTVQKVYSLEVEDNNNYFVVSADYDQQGYYDKLSTPILVKNCQSMSPGAWYSGSPLQVNFGETGPSGVLIVDTEDFQRPVFHEIKSTRLVTIRSDEAVPTDAIVRVMYDDQPLLATDLPANVVKVAWQAADVDLSDIRSTEGLLAGLDVVLGRHGLDEDEIVVALEEARRVAIAVGDLGVLSAA